MLLSPQVRTWVNLRFLLSRLLSMLVLTWLSPGPSVLFRGIISTALTRSSARTKRHTHEDFIHASQTPLPFQLYISSSLIVFLRYPILWTLSFLPLLLLLHLQIRVRVVLQVARQGLKQRWLVVQLQIILMWDVLW